MFKEYLLTILLNRAIYFSVTINSRYYKTESEISTSSFVKIEKAPVNIVIDYYGAKIQTNDNNLAYVLSAIKDAYTI